MRGSGLRLSHSFTLLDGSKRRGLTAVYRRGVVEVGVLLVLHHLRASPCNFPEGTALRVNLPVLQNKVQSKSKAEGYTHPCVPMEGGGWRPSPMSI